MNNEVYSSRYPGYVKKFETASRKNTLRIAYTCTVGIASLNKDHPYFKARREIEG